MTEGYQALTEKEKQTLRLVVRGYDAKSMARHLGLSVHTINERLRYARRKMAVSSSREAARLLLDEECDGPLFLADKQLGEARSTPRMGQVAAPKDSQGTRPRLALAIAGVLIMFLFLATLAVTSSPQLAASPAASGKTAPAAPAESAAVQAARQWLALVDEGKWSESWDATGEAFKKLNTSEIWASVSERVRVPLGAVISRTANAEESVPAPPYGYEMVKFHTSFANKPDTTETVTLSREGGSWRVVGYLIG